MNTARPSRAGFFSGIAVSFGAGEKQLGAMADEAALVCWS